LVLDSQKAWMQKREDELGAGEKKGRSS